MERYIGLDPHGTSCTFGMIGPSGRRLRHDVVETSGAALVSYLRNIPGRKHLCLEEGTQSAWLYEILSPHVEDIVVAGIRREPRSEERCARCIQLPKIHSEVRLPTPRHQSPTD